MIKTKIFPILLLVLIVICFNNTLTSEDNKTIVDRYLNPNNSQDNDDEPIVNKVGVLLKRSKNNNDHFFLIEDDTKIRYNIRLNHNNTSMLKLFTHFRVSINGRLFSNDVSENNILVRKIEIVYREIETTGKLSVRGSPRKLIFKTEDSSTDYFIVDERQENYKEYKKEYQQYKIKITGKYYSKNYFNKEKDLIETKFLIIDTIEKIK